MSKFRALELAIMQATQQRDAQARKHAQAQRTLQFAHGQMEQLHNYANDTDARWIGGHAVNLSVELVKHHYQFMERLQNAVNLQHGVISNLERQLAAVHQALLQAEARLAGFEQVLKSRRAALGLVEQRREQRVTDEFAAMRHARNRAAQTLEEAL
ncbi:MAG: flagellar FliJ family protein [Rhodoferax sp.]|nr:flagellar FliJ family protein [Rhodoferax sp.]